MKKQNCQKFIELYSVWKHETSLESNPRKIFENTNYKKIVSLVKVSDAVVEEIIKIIRKKPDFIVFALVEGLYIEPYKETYKKGRLDIVCDAWVKWYDL